MSNSRGHKDLLHDGVGRFFKERGFDALDLKRLGEGVPDWAFFKGLTLAFLVEVKTVREDRRMPTKLNEKQQEFHARWHSPIFIVSSIADCWALLEKITAEAAE